MFGYEHESFVELAKLELHKKKAPPKDSFDLALEKEKKEGNKKKILSGFDRQYAEIMADSPINNE